MANFGIYRGIVTNNIDPKGRVQISLPFLAASNQQWANVCTAFGAPPNTRPSVGTQVWVAFEAGDPRFPIVLGTAKG